jgi:tRNA(Leu) C34 or U34 (ribose-2'-O)-methylase TrmL
MAAGAPGERWALRYYYAGEDASDGRLLPLPGGADAPPTAAAAVALLAGAVDLALFAPHVRPAADDAWVPLVASGAPAAAGPARRLDVRLWPAAPPPPAGPAAAAALTCDSAAAGLTASFFGIGIARGRSVANHGTVWRTALQMGAAFTFTVGAGYSRKVEGAGDVYKTHRSIPCIAYADWAALTAGAPVGSEVVAVEYGGRRLSEFDHPRRAVYVLGGETEGLDAAIVARARHHVAIDVVPGRPASLNVASAAAIVLWDRRMKERRGRRRAPDGSS